MNLTSQTIQNKEFGRIHRLSNLEGQGNNGKNRAGNQGSGAASLGGREVGVGRNNFVDLGLNGSFIKAGGRSGLVPRDSDEESVVTNFVNTDVHGVNAELVGNEELDVFLGQGETLDGDLDGEGEALAFRNSLRAVLAAVETRGADRAIEAVATSGGGILADGTSAVRAASTFLSNVIVIVIRAVTSEGRADNGVAVVDVTADGAALVLNANRDLTISASNSGAHDVVLALALLLADRAAVVVIDCGVGTVLAGKIGAHHSGAVNLGNADLAATAIDFLFTVAALNLRAGIRAAGVNRAASSAAVIRTFEVILTFSAVD